VSGSTHALLGGIQQKTQRTRPLNMFTLVGDRVRGERITRIYLRGTSWHVENTQGTPPGHKVWNKNCAGGAERVDRAWGYEEVVLGTPNVE
jgi:hypothetical protein